MNKVIWFLFIYFHFKLLSVKYYQTQKINSLNNYKYEQKNLVSLFLVIIFITVKAQNIDMKYAAYAGKSYVFVIFQGDEQKQYMKEKFRQMESSR